MNISVELIPNRDNNSLVKKFITKHWGSVNIVSRGKITDASSISRIIFKNESNNIVGLNTFLIDKKNNTCEGISINTKIQGKGIGTKMMKLFEKTTKKNGVKKIWFITTNDNWKAAIFYIKNGYRLVNIHRDALDTSRKLKPQIPLKGKYGIPLQDEWEFEKYI